MINDIVLITSVINTGNQPWSYTPNRSVYSPQERYEQTLQTIQSVKEHLPDAKIFLVECSDISSFEIKDKVDYFLNLYENPEVRSACLETNKKGFGEAVQTKAALEYILEMQILFHRFFKISGRYFLNENFNSMNYLSDMYTFKKHVVTGDGAIAISTVVYSVPFKLRKNFYITICDVVNYYDCNGPKGLEELLPIRCTPRHEIDTMGVSGYVAVAHGDFFTA